MSQVLCVALVLIGLVLLVWYVPAPKCDPKTWQRDETCPHCGRRLRVRLSGRGDPGPL